MNKLYLLLLLIVFSSVAFSPIIATEKNPKKEKNNTSTERYYASSQKEGYIGVFDKIPLDSPTDNIFTVFIKNLPASDEQVYLTYELYGISNHTGISRSINEQLSVGGYFVTKNNSWQLQEEQLKVTWLKQGENNIRFTLPNQAQYNYRIRNLGILIKKTGLQGRAIIINQPLNQEYSNNIGYLKGFVQGKGSEKAQIFIDGSSIQSLSSEFEALLPKKSNKKQWTATIKVVYADGETIEKQIIYTQPNIATYQNKIAVRSADYTLAEYTPEKAVKLSIKGAALTIQPQALVKVNSISITALRTVDIPALDGTMVNVTKNHDGYRFLPHGTQFTKETQVAIEYDVAKIPEGYTEKDIKTYYFDDISKHWVALKRDSIQNKENTILSKTTHFTDMINGVIKVPESPETAGFTPTSIKDIKAAHPSVGVNTIEPPSANNMGSAALGYPIVLPAGRQGMQPQLSIQYNSAGSNDWLGVGWNLTVPSIGIDTRWGVPRYDGVLETETYVIEGEELAPVAHRGDLQPRSGEKQFYPRVEGSFNKIIRHGDNPKNYWWEVTDKSGTKYSYGGTTSLGIIDSSVLKDGDGNLSHWGLVEMRDLNDNFVRYRYTKVQDVGVQGGTVAGYNNYINKITYTGFGSSEGKYEVLFIRDRELAEAKRMDVSINARYGFKQVTADLLRKIEVQYNQQNIRSYALHYKQGAFYKTLLDKITEFDATGAEFNHHDLEYFDDVKAAEGYQPYTATENWTPQDDNVKGDFLVRVGEFNDNASALLGNKSSGFGFGLSLTVGYKTNDLQLFHKMNTVGANFGFGQNKGEGMLSMIDINGDNLPDKVYTNNGVIKFRPNQSGPYGTTVFGQEKTVFGIGSFSSSKSETFSYGLEANFKVTLGLTKSDTKTTVKTYFCDVNGDGLMDIVHKGVVCFNHLENGIPTYTLSSGDTPSAIGESTTGIDPNLLQIDPLELEKLIDQYPLHDMVRMWEAPYTGTVNIDAPVSLNLNEQSIDGVRVAIQHKETELWNTTIAAGDFTLKTPALAPIAVTKGDKIYFRLQSVFDGEGDVVDWNPIVTYNQHTTNLVDANNLPIYQFKASDGFILSAMQTTGTPIDGAVTIDGLFEKPATTDDVTVAIIKTDENGVVTTVFQNTYLANQVVSQTLNVPLTVAKNQTYSFSVTADSNIDWKALHWTPRIVYTASTDPNITTVNNPDGSPMYAFFPVVDYGLYEKTVQPTALWKATIDTPVTVSPQLTFTDVSLQGQAVFTIKKNNILVAKQNITVVSGVASGIAPIPFNALANEIFSFDIYTKNPVLAAGITQASFTLVADTTAILKMGIATQDKSGIFGPMYRHWGQFGYNGNRDRGTQPINESELVITSSNTGTIDLSGATTADEMEAAYASQGGQNVNDTKFILLLPDNVKKIWKGYDDKHWMAQFNQSASRLGMDNLTIENPATSGGEAARGIDKVSKSYSVGLMVSAGIGGSTAIGGTKSITEFSDLNGDRYPDIISENKIQYTKADGTLESTAKNIGTSYYQESKNSAIGISMNGSPLLSKSQISAEIPKSIRNPVKFDSKGHIMAPTKEEDASHTPSISGSLSINTDDSQHSFIDVNGDGLPDKVYQGGDVALNLGYSFAPKEKWNFVSIRKGKGEDFSAGLGFSLYNNSISGGVGLNMSLGHAQNAVQDVNGDGLVDYFNKDDNTVFLNTGNGFVQIPWNGIEDIQESVDVGESANAAFTVSIPIPPLLPGIKISINPSANVSHSASRETVSITDLDGDGYPDILASKKDNQLTVKRSTIARTNLLREVKRPMGASFTMDYARIGNTYDQPSDVWALTKVELKDGFTGDGPDTMISTFEYENGHYDRHERDFYGFKTVKSHQLDTQNSDAVYRTVVQEFSNDNYYEKGVLQREILQDANHNLYIESLNNFELKDIQTGATLPASFKTNDKETAFLAPVKTQKNFYEGGTNAQKSTSSIYNYDTLGNVTSFTDFGDTGTDDDISSVINYHAVPGKYIMGMPSRVVVTGGGQTLRKSETTIDNNTGNVTQIRKITQNGTASTYDLQYDSYGNLTKITRPENAAGERLFFNYQYDPEVHTYTTGVSDGYGYSYSSIYDFRFGQMLENTDLNGHKMRYEIDNLGRVKTITGPFELALGLPYTIAFNYHPEATVPWASTKHYDPAHPENPIETVTFTDGIKRAIQVKKDTDMYTAPQAADVEKMIVSGRIIFDAFGRTLESYYPITEPKGSETVFNANYDNITPSKTAYDVLDRTTTVTLPDAAVSSIVYGFGNDRDGALQFSTKAIDANGIWKESYTNVRGLTKAVQEQYSQGSNVWTSYNYNAISELMEVKDDQNNEIKSTYDWLGRRTQVIHPDAGTSTFEYDLANNLTKKLTANLTTLATPITYQYDKERLVEINYPQNPQNNVKYTYGAMGATDNRAGRIILQQDASGAQEFFYNPLGAVTKNIRTIMVPDSQLLTYSTQWKYDTWNRITQMTYPDQEVLTYTYNLGGLLHSMKGVKNGTQYKYLTQLGYDKFEQRTYLSYGNGTETFYEYEPERRRLHNMVTETATNRKMMDNVYTYDKVNNILRLQNNAEIPASNLMGGQTDYNYTYDDLYQLTNATGSHKGSNHENKYNLAMTYNSVHSIVRKEQNHQFKDYDVTSWSPRNQTTYTADYAYGQTQPHAPTHIGDKTYTYDANGNQTAWTDDNSGQNRQILWDEENRIKAIADNGAMFNYVYDAGGERILKSNGGSQSIAVNGSTKGGKSSIGNYTIYVNPYLVIRNSQATKHFYIESQRIATKLAESNEGLLQTTAGGNIVKYGEKQAKLNASVNKLYADFGLETEKVTSTGATTGTGSTTTSGNGTTNEKFIFYYHPDHLGSSSYISDANGEVQQHLEYFAFGETFLEEHSNTDSTPYLFNGKELDEQTGLYYYGARYYDAKTSVWSSVDALAERHPEISPFVYCANNPIKFIDPDGRDWVEANNGDITWRKNVNSKNHSKTLKGGEIYRGKSFERIKDWDGVINSNGNIVNNIVLEEYGENKKITYSELTSANVSVEGSMREGNSKLGDVEVKIYLTFGNGKIRFMKEAYSAVAGGFGNGAPENGNYTITNYQNRSPTGWYNKGMNNNGVGFSFNLNPSFSTGRTDLRIHPDGNNEGTLGCIGMSGNTTQLNSFTNSLRMVQKYQTSIPATLYITGNPNNNGKSGAKLPNINE